MSDDALSTKKPKRRASDRFTLPRFMLVCGAMGYMMVAGTYALEARKQPWAHEPGEPWKTAIPYVGGMVWPLLAAPQFGKDLARARAYKPEATPER